MDGRRFGAHFEDARVHELAGAVIQANFLARDTWAALVSGIDRDFAASLPDTPSKANVLVLLDTLNRVERLITGEIPLQLFLRNAVFMAGNLVEKERFQRALADLDNRILGVAATTGAANLPELRGAREEAIVGVDETLGFGFLRAAYLAGKSVGLIRVTEYAGDRPRLIPGGHPAISHGTAWLIGWDLVITCYHVIKSRPLGSHATPVEFELQARHAQIRFDYDDDVASAQWLGGADDQLTLVASSEHLDYTILRVPHRPPATAGDVRGPHPTRPALHLSRQPLQRAPAPAELDPRIPVNIIQHPDARPKRIGFRSNLVTAGDDTELRYFTDTRPGSSGSPVCTDDWLVVALHRGADIVQHPSYQGKQAPWVNFGVQIAKVLGHLEQANREIYDEIRRCQIEMGSPGWD